MPATTYTLVPIPLWYFADNAGLPAGLGSMATYRDIDRVTPKAVYVDAQGTNAWPNPLNWNANGESPGLIFWADDELYYIEFWDGPNATGNRLWTVGGYGPGVAGGGGGGGGTTNINHDNFITNNVFWRNIGPNSNLSFQTLSNGMVLAPSNHEGLSNSIVAPSLSTGFSKSDIIYIASDGSGSTDQVSFPSTIGNFSSGQVPLLASDVTPEYYCQIKCTVAGNESLKCVQFPVDLHVKNLEQETMTAMIWARGNSGTQNLTMNFVQNFGTGSPSATVYQTISIAASPLTASWQPYVATFTVPSIAGKTMSVGGNDASYIQVSFPTSATFDISFTKPKLYLGTIGAMFQELQTYDRINSITSSPRTGDIRTSMNSFQPFGWVSMNDGSIGSAASVATNRNNIDTWSLYSLLWNNVSDVWAPVSTGRGATAIADFGANKTLTLTKSLGRVLAGNNPGFQVTLTFTAVGATDLITVSSTATLPTGTPVLVSGGSLPTPLVTNTVYYVINISGTTLKLALSVDLAQAGTPIDIDDGSGNLLAALGAAIGEGVHTLTEPELALHTHVLQGRGSAGGDFNPLYTAGSPVDINRTTTSAGQDQPHNTMQPSLFTNVFIKL